MNRRHFLIAAPLLLAGCTGRFATDFETPLSPDITRAWQVTGVDVSVSEDLTVSENNSYAPRADIVWHGEPAGDRRAQVAAIIEDGIMAGAAPLDGGRKVVIAADLERFHAVTPRAVSRAPAAVHDIIFTAQVRDAATGAPLSSMDRIQADIEAYVGAAAVIAAQEGQTQRVRVVNHIADTTAAWLGVGPDNRRSFVSLGR